MKHPHSPCGGHLLILGTACLGLICQVSAQNAVDPVEIFPVAAPQPVVETIHAAPTLSLSEEELRMCVHVLGSKLKANPRTAKLLELLKSSHSGFSPKASRKLKNKLQNASAEPLIEIVWSKNKSEWARLICDSRGAVVSAGVVLDTVVFSDDVIDFGARLCQPGWLPLHSTSGNTQNLIVLKNGDPTPWQIARCKPGQIDGFLKPYLSADAQTVQIRDGDLLILAELDQTHPKAAGFDYQDLGLLVTFD